MGIDKEKKPSSANKLRHCAEVQQKAKSAGLLRPRAEEEEQSLLLELEVHQIELEMQNAELRQSREELERALDKYTELYDFAPVGYFTLDLKGAISALNLSGACLLGDDRSKLIGRNFGQFVTVKDRTNFLAFLGTVFNSQVKEVSEVALLNKGDLPLIVQIEAISAASGLECRLALIDITGRRQAEDALLAKEEAHWSLIKNLPVGVVVHDSDTRIVLCNPEASQLLGIPSDKMLGMSARDKIWHFVREDGTRMPVDEFPPLAQNLN